MRLNIKKETKNSVEFVLEESTPAFANTLRRYILGAVPTMAVQDVIIEANTSGLFDEVIAQRMGLIPLTFDSRIYKIKEECRCGGDGCSKCQVTLVLDKKGPCSVFAGDMKSIDPSVKPVSNAVPIAELLEGQTLKLEAIAGLGCGSVHSKHQAATVGYKYYPKLSLTGKGELQQAMELCPKNVFAEKNGKITIANADNCDMCMKCMLSKAVNISSNNSKFIFRVEGVSGIDTVTIIKDALEQISKDAKNVASEIKKKC